VFGLGQVAAAVSLIAVSAVPAGKVAAACDGPALAPSRTVSAVPHVQELYDIDHLAALATGTGIRVAVIDSGVDAKHPQLKAKGAVVAGRDFLRGAADGRQDCNGHGTMVASIIAARKVPGTPFHGLAPDATIVPVRVSEQTESAEGTQVGDAASVRRFAEAIVWSADPDGGAADVINLSLTTTVNDPEVRDAVAAAVKRGVVVVAATGNDGAQQRGNPTPYPAAYPGVIGVGAVDTTGQILGFSGHGPFVDLAAPGDRITAAARRGGQTEFTGTSAATPLVAATAALILQRYPGSTPEQVQQRIVSTADPSPGGGFSNEYGYGILNPYRAVSESLNTEPRPTRVVATMPPADPAKQAALQRRAASRRTALIFAAAGGGTALLIGFGAVTIRAGRRRGWQPGALD
jgi:type VII secretion-associated serine protease mycosin